MKNHNARAPLQHFEHVRMKWRIAEVIENAFAGIRVFKKPAR